VFHKFGKRRTKVESKSVSIAENIIGEKEVFTIITSASEAMDFINKSFKAYIQGEHELHEQFLESADQVLDKAHEMQAQMIQNELNGNGSAVTMMMVHAQDHLMNVILAKQMIQYFFDLIDTIRKKG
jgi:PTS system cellobiose-specific IIA component